MTATKNKTRVGMVAAMAVLSMASLFALASPASALTYPGEPVITGVTTTLPDTVTVKFDPAPTGSGDPALTYIVTAEKWATPVNSNIVKSTTINETGLAHYEAPITGLPAGDYQIVVRAHNNAPAPFNDSTPAVWPGKITIPGAASPVATAFAPYANWDALIKGEYKMWTGCGAISTGRGPRLDELTFWHYNIAVKPFTSDENFSAYYLDYDQYPPAPAAPSYYVPSTFLAYEFGLLTAPANIKAAIDHYFSATALAYNPPTGPYALADNGAGGGIAKNGILEVGELNAAVSTAQPLAVNDIYRNRRATFIQTLAEGAEQTDGPAIRLYTAYFGRDVDMGACYWSRQLQSSKMSLLGISNFFVNSSEFINTYGAYTTDAAEPGTDAAEFVALIYQNVLNRDPDAAGFSYWTRQLQSQRKSPAEVMIGFSEAPEFKNKRSLSTGVAMTYIHMLGRVPTSQEYTNANTNTTWLATSPECNWSWWGCNGAVNFSNPVSYQRLFVGTGPFSLYLSLIGNAEYVARAATASA